MDWIKFGVFVIGGIFGFILIYITKHLIIMFNNNKSKKTKELSPSEELIRIIMKEEEKNIKNNNEYDKLKGTYDMLMKMIDSEKLQVDRYRLFREYEKLQSKIDCINKPKEKVYYANEVTIKNKNMRDKKLRKELGIQTFNNFHSTEWGE